MSQEKSPNKAGATELKEEDLDQIRGGVAGTRTQNFRVEINGVTQGAVKDTQDR